MAKIDFSKIEQLLVSSKDFSLTEEQYKKLTKRAMPKDTSYLVSRSALARVVKKHGMKIVVHERTILFEKEKAEV